MANTHSIDFEDDSSQCAWCADSVSLSITGDISIECWFKLESLPSSQAAHHYTLASKANTTGNKVSYYFELRYGDDKAYFTFSHDGSSGSRANMDTAFVGGDVGQWIHLAVIVDVSAGASGIKFYKNGSLMADTDGVNNSTSIHDNDSRFGIGCLHEATTPVGFFDGKIDEVRIWNDIRTATEISEFYRREIGTDASLKGYWKLNNDYLDGSGNNNTLTAVASPVFSTDVPFTGARGLDLTSKYW